MEQFEADLAAVQTGLGSVNTDPGRVVDVGRHRRRGPGPQPPGGGDPTGDRAAEIERSGGTISDEDRDAAEAQLAAQQAGWDDRARAVPHVLHRVRRRARHVFSRMSTPSVDELAAAYSAGIEQSGYACVSHILVDTEEEALAVVERLEAGEDFATVAAEVSTDPSAAQTGGALVGQDGSACMTSETFAASFIPEFVEGAFAAEVGVPTQPVQSEFGYHVILVRPFEEVSDDVVAAAQVGELQTRLAALVADADVTVNRSIGKWSSPTGEVVALSAVVGQ